MGTKCALTSGQISRLARGLASASRVDGFGDDLARDGRILFEVVAKTFVDEGFDLALHVGVELALGLSLELWLRQLDADDCDQPFAHVFRGELLVVFLEETGRLCVVIYRPGERRSKARQVRSAVHRVDVVGE